MLLWWSIARNEKKNDRQKWLFYLNPIIAASIYIASNVETVISAQFSNLSFIQSYPSLVLSSCPLGSNVIKLTD